MFLDGNRTRIFSFSRAALTQLSYLPSSITEAQRPILRKRTTDKGEMGIHRLPDGARLNALAVSRFTDNPNSTARRNWRARWESNPRLPNLFGCSIAVELRDCPRSPRLRTNLVDAVLSRAPRMSLLPANDDGQVT
jgi:hypothetical protein